MRTIAISDVVAVAGSGAVRAQDDLDRYEAYRVATPIAARFVPLREADANICAQ